MRRPLVRIVVRGIMVGAAIVALLLGALFALGSLLGDPGYLYRPADAGGRPIDRWFRTIEGVSLEGGLYDTLIGERQRRVLGETHQRHESGGHGPGRGTVNQRADPEGACAAGPTTDLLSRISGRG